ncbi:adenosine deaminase family protein [candidate division KSB1 bacterium]|nr:adenosine deaminase family protein [candidate division KSB1 bacterium]TDJ01586.1 MAG: adenosine deaminase family protein [Caldithrix sp.]
MTQQSRIKYTEEVAELINLIPKTDLHVHLDGSLRLQTLTEIAKQENVELPSSTVEGLNELVFKDNYANLEEYLKTFGYACAVMQKPEYLERIAYELAQDNQNEGVRYIEVRFAPQLHINKKMDMKKVIASVDKGLECAQKEFNLRPEVKSGQEPPFNYGIIVSALRAFGPYSEYYANFINSLAYSDMKDIVGLCSLELARGAVKTRDELGVPIVALDLAGAEKGNPAKDHRKAFQYAHENFLAKTVHAGEAYGPSSIFQAITECHAERIGHGMFLFDITKVDEDSRIDKERYVDELSQYIADRRVTIEVCLTSNLQTNPGLKSLEQHSFKKMIERELSTTICTDNRTVSKTTVTNEIKLALQNFDMNPRTLKNTIVYGFKRSFFPDRYAKKRQYVRQCIDYYEKLVQGTILEA